MNRKLKTLAICIGLLSFQAQALTAKEIKKYVIDFNQDFRANCSGYTPAVGSSLAFKGKEGEELVFYGITDRGPNLPLPIIDEVSSSYFGKNSKISEMIYGDPKFSPQIAEIRISKNQAKVSKHIALWHMEKDILGTPPCKNKHETPIDKNFQKIDCHDWGFDTEAIAIDKNGDFWLADEYHPAILHVEKDTGRIKKVFSPGNGIPEIFDKRLANRGFESIAVSSDQKIYAILESPIKTGNEEENFIRFLELNPSTNKTRVYLYPLTSEFPNAKYKLSDMEYLKDNKFLVVEQLVLRDKILHHIYEIELPKFGSKSASSNNLIRKKLILDVDSLGWNHEKLEGLTIIDKETIAIANDNDFGLTHAEVDENSKKIDFIHDKDLHSEIWVIKLNKPIR